MKGLTLNAPFFAVLRDPVLFDGPLTQAQVDGVNALLAATGAADWPVAYVAYGLATAFHETAKRMQPIREIGHGAGRAYARACSNGQVAYGRGLVQLTWEAGYQRADHELGLEGRLCADFDLALDPKVASDILVRGMAEGWFTGKKLADYLPADATANWAQFVDARRIINGIDRAGIIAGYAIKFQSALLMGAWA